MPDFLRGLRDLFNGEVTPAQKRQEEATTPRTAPVQPSQEAGGAPVYDAAEMERMERQRLLEEALQQLRPIDGRIIPRNDEPRPRTPSVGVRG